MFLSTLCAVPCSHAVVSYSLRSHGTVAARLLCPQGFFRQEYWGGLPCPLPEDLPNPGIEPRPPALQADYLPSAPSGKPKNTGVGSLCLLQGIFPTQESNRGFLHCRQILLLTELPGSRSHTFLQLPGCSNHWTLAIVRVCVCVCVCVCACTCSVAQSCLTL